MFILLKIYIINVHNYSEHSEKKKTIFQIFTFVKKKTKLYLSSYKSKVNSPIKRENLSDDKGYLQLTTSEQKI